MHLADRPAHDAAAGAAIFRSNLVT